MKQIKFVISSRNNFPIVCDNGEIKKTFFHLGIGVHEFENIANKLLEYGFFYDQKNEYFFTYYYKFLWKEIQNRIDTINKFLSEIMKVI